MAQNNRNLFFYILESRNLEINVSTGPFSLQRFYGTFLFFPCLFWLLMAMTNVWHFLVSGSIILVWVHFSHGLLPFVSVYKSCSSFSYRDTSAHPKPVWLHMNWIISTKTLFSNSHVYKYQQIRLQHIFWEETIQSQTVYPLFPAILVFLICEIHSYHHNIPECLNLFEH